MGDHPRRHRSASGGGIAASVQAMGRHRKLSPEQEAAVRHSYWSNQGDAFEIGLAFGVSERTVYRALSRK